MIKDFLRFLSPKFQTLFLEYKVDMQPRYGHGKPPHPELYDIIDQRRADYEGLIDTALGYRHQLHSIQQFGVEKDTSRPAWNNGFLPGLDIVALYTMVAHFKPKHYVEIGSGNSTKVAHLAKQDNALHTEITSIDPMPRAEIDTLADFVVRKRFEDSDYDLVCLLEPNDILFVDNSHRILPNSDSMVFYMEILPRLRPGVIVHIHDIYLPYDYPQFMCERFYSEQYGLAMYLLANPDKYQTLLPNYFVSEDPALRDRLAPMWDHANLKEVERHGGSYWLQING